MRPGSTGTDGRTEMGVACPLLSFFNKLHYRHRLDTFIYYFRRVREPYLAMLCPSSSFFAPASTARIYIDHTTGIHWLGWVDRNRPSVPYILFFSKVLYRYKLDTHIYNYRRVREPYPARLGSSDSFSSPASRGGHQSRDRDLPAGTVR